MSPPFDQTKLIPADLAKNPHAVRGGTITAAQCEVDDAPTYGALTKIGPTFPTGSTLDSCWIESTKYNALAAGVKPPRINYGMQCRDYELTTVTYYSGTLANRRFWGFYVEITSEQGTQALCSVWPAGKSLVSGQQPAVSSWIDLSTQAHPIETGFTQVGVGLGVPKQGALFIDAPTATNLHLSGPKLPPAKGFERIPVRR